MTNKGFGMADFFVKKSHKPLILLDPVCNGLLIYSDYWLAVSYGLPKRALELSGAFLIDTSIEERYSSLVKLSCVG